MEAKRLKLDRIPLLQIQKHRELVQQEAVYKSFFSDWIKPLLPQGLQLDYKILLKLLRDQTL